MGLGCVQLRTTVLRISLALSVKTFLPANFLYNRHLINYSHPATVKCVDCTQIVNFLILFVVRFCGFVLG